MLNVTGVYAQVSGWVMVAKEIAWGPEIKGGATLFQDWS